MIRFVFTGGVGVIVLIAYVFAVLDVISTDEMLIRNMPKLAWLFVVLFVPLVGTVAWFAVGRPIGAGLSPGSTRTSPNRSWQQERGSEPRRPRPRGPEDRDDWPST